MCKKNFAKESRGIPGPGTESRPSSTASRASTWAPSLPPPASNATAAPGQCGWTHRQHGRMEGKPALAAEGVGREKLGGKRLGDFRLFRKPKVGLHKQLPLLSSLDNLSPWCVVEKAKPNLGWKDKNFFEWVRSKINKLEFGVFGWGKTWKKPQHEGGNPPTCIETVGHFCSPKKIRFESLRRNLSLLDIPFSLVWLCAVECSRSCLGWVHSSQRGCEKYGIPPPPLDSIVCEGFFPYRLHNRPKKKEGGDWEGRK